MAGMWSRCFAGVAFSGAALAGLAAQSASLPDAGSDSQTNRAVLEAPPEAVTRAVRLALRRVAIADRNHDGTISDHEATAYYDARFDLMDLDQDRVLSRTEFVDSGLAIAARAAARHEIGWHRPKRFESLDLDGDDALDREEFALALLLARRSKDATPRHQRRGETFDRFDQDGDGMLSQGEFSTAGGRHFAASDADGDGRVTIWEFLSRLRF